MHHRPLISMSPVATRRDAVQPRAPPPDNRAKIGFEPRIRGDLGICRTDRGLFDLSGLGKSAPAGSQIHLVLLETGSFGLSVAPRPITYSRHLAIWVILERTCFPLSLVIQGSTP